MGIRVFTSQMLRDSMPENELSALVVKFRTYKETGIVPELFGRDVPYHRPNAVAQADMHHIHMRENQNWGINLVQFRRISDTALVYCRGFHSRDNYLLICILNNAHERANKVTFMLSLADSAEKFRERY